MQGRRRRHVGQIRVYFFIEVMSTSPRSTAFTVGITMQTRAAFAATARTAGIGTRAQRSARRTRACTASPQQRSKRVRTNNAGQVVVSSVAQHVATIRDVLQPLTNEKYAKEMAVYVRGQFAFYGISAPHRRAATKSAIADVRNQSANDPTLGWRLCAALWELEEREMQYVGLDVLDACRKHWMCAENGQFLEFQSLLESFVVKKQWWDSIDMLASHAVADVFEMYPEEMRSTLERWIVAEDVWFRRTAILFQLRRKKDTDVEMLFRFVQLRMGDEEFWIRKAIGWALRSYRRTDAAVVDRFVEENLDSLSKLSVKEAWKHKK